MDKILRKRKQKGDTYSKDAKPQFEQQQKRPTTTTTKKHNTANERSHYDSQRQKSYEQYVELSQCNSTNFQFSNKYLPHSVALNNKYRSSLSCFFSAVGDADYEDRSGTKIPRCGFCRAYMNYYNTVDEKGFRCFLCGRTTMIPSEYAQEECIEKQQANYLVNGPQNFYHAAPPQRCYIFLIDVGQSSYECKMLDKVSQVMKMTLQRQELDDSQIYFYTYDSNVHEYDFSGEEPERTVIDFTIKNQDKIQDNYLGSIRDKLFMLLDNLEDMAKKQTKNGSNFYGAFEYVYENVRHTGGKMFVFQSNDAIVGQQFTSQKASQNQQLQKIKSFLETKNKTFFNRYVQAMLNDNISMSLFIVARSFKNIRVFSDVCKLTNSELLYYNKDSFEDMNKFYYDFYKLLNATYYIDTRIELVMGQGWYFTAVYGNLYRLKEHISFKFCHYEPSKKICAVFLPQQGNNNVDYFTFQLITNYIYDRKHYMQINTVIMPLTTKVDRLFDNMNTQISVASIFKSYLSSLRLEELNVCKQRYIKQVGTIWRSCNQYYQKKIPADIRAMFLAYLSFLKNYHTQIDIINDTIHLQKICSQRNLLQGCNFDECILPFQPYLFKIDNMTSDLCNQDNFMYPETCELRFSEVKEGVYLMDAGTALYLYFGKTYNPQVCRSLLGHDKLNRNDRPTQYMLNEQNTQMSLQVQQLLRVRRQQSTYQYMPLHIVKCGQNSIHQKEFYLHFYEEKYDQYKSYKMTLQEFVGMLQNLH